MITMPKELREWLNILDNYEVELYDESEVQELKDIIESQEYLISINLEKIEKLQKENKELKDYINKLANKSKV
jgi:bifunctional DNA-binding transcriptional regulator/antitoxin component of YhaV-PrlF toxin-antitoxin module